MEGALTEVPAATDPLSAATKARTEDESDEDVILRPSSPRLSPLQTSGANDHPIAEQSVCDTPSATAGGKYHALPPPEMAHVPEGVQNTADALPESVSAETYAKQHAELARLRLSLETTEGERASLARRVASLSAERESCMRDMAETSRKLAAAQRAAEAAEAARRVERKEDEALFNANLQRLLGEKAQLLDEVEMASGQKDALTEALVAANASVAQSRRLDEELETWKKLHKTVTEQLQVAHTERDAARAEIVRERSSRAGETSKLRSSHAALAAQSDGISKLQCELEAALADAERARSDARASEERARREAVDGAGVAAELEQSGGRSR